MANKKLHIRITDEDGDERTLIVPKHTVRNVLLATGAITLLLVIGSLQAARYLSDNKKLQLQVNHLRSEIEQSVPRLGTDMQHQVDVLKNQLTAAKNELATRSQRKAELIRQYEQEIAQLKKKQQTLTTVSVTRLNERTKVMDSIMKRLGVEAKIKDNPRHSGGLFIASTKQRNEERLQDDTDNYLDSIENLPIGKPVPTTITSPFGARKDPLNRKNAFHEGVDFDGNKGDLVFSTGYGTVKRSCYSKDYGEYIIIAHGNGFETLFAHLSKRLVKKGTQIKNGDKIGRIGSTGRSTGSHLHYEIRYKGKPVDPMKYIEVAKNSLPVKRTAR
jgi:murein DD-endopeptidase MepM/ murein hydrolase activator NlpD